VLSPPDHDGFDARAGIERSEEVADVVPHGLDAEVELARWTRLMASSTSLLKDFNSDMPSSLLSLGCGANSAGRRRGRGRIRRSAVRGTVPVD
jgi:hypothetical protein